MITTVAGTGTPGFSGDGGPATGAQLNAPWSATPAAAGGFFVADQNNNRIRLVSASGSISTVAGVGASSGRFAGDGGPATSAVLSVPANVLEDVAGNIYVADTGNNRVRRISAATGIISTIAGTDGESFSGDGGPANNAGLYGPYAFALDAKGNLYIADVFHNRIREVSANQAVLNYPVMRVGRVSTPLGQTLENDGNAAMNLSGIVVVTNAQVDTGTTTCAVSAPLAPLAQCNLGIDFAPTSTGAIVTGSVDVNSDAGNSPGVIKLVGQVLSVNPTQISLTSSQNPSATGSAVTFSLAVNSSGATPTGSVTLLEGTTNLGTATLQAGGVASISLSNLTSGSHTLTASYTGDSENAAGVSPSLIQIVRDQQAATNTVLTGGAGPSPAGGGVSFTATVSVVTSNSGNGNIAGSVVFKQGVNTLGVADINNATASSSVGVATVSLSNLPVGSDSIVAVYSGSSNYLASTSSPFTTSVVLATTRNTIATSANPSNAGAALVLTANLLSNGGVPGGSVVFLDGSTSLGSAMLNAQGTAVLQVSGRLWTVGDHALSAVYNGDANDAGSTSPSLAEVIAIAPSTTFVTSSLNPAGLGASVSFTAAVSTQGGVPTGAVQFFDGGTSIGSANLTASGASSGTAVFSTATLPVGAHQITAVYAGDTYTASATSPVLTETIQNTTIAATLQTTAASVIFGSPLTLTATITGSGSVPTGTVALMDGTLTVATLPVPANGVVSFVNPPLAIGTHTLTAAYSGDTNHTAIASAPLNETILQATTTALTPSSNALISGKPLTLTAVVVGVSGKPFTGTVNFTDGAALLGSVTPNASGMAIYTTAALPPGQHTLVAAYSGDAIDAASTSSPLTVSITLATTTTSLSTNANPLNSGSLLTLTSTVAGNGGIPTGTVTFHDGGTILTSVQLTSAGTATFSLSTLTPGIHLLSASYSGDILDGVSTSPTISEQIAQVTSVTLASATNPSLLQDSVALTITVSNGAPSQPPTGSVILLDGTTPLATLNLNGTGNASYTFVAPSLGTHTLVVKYAGDNSNSPATSAPFLQVVTLRPSSVNFKPSVTALSSGQQVTLISVVQASGSVPATGTVTWISGSTTLGSTKIDATGLASLTVTPPQGTFATVAQYSGDGLYAPSVSAATTIIVGPTIEFTIHLTPDALTIKSGDRGSLKIDIASAPSFSDTLAMGCAGLPTDATCTFSLPQVPVTGGASPSLSVIVDTGDPLGAGATARNHSDSRAAGLYACAMPLGALFALLLGFNRRRLRAISPRLALLVLILLMGAGSAALSGCGTSIHTNHTAPANYTFQVVASGNKTGVTQTTTVQLTVTP